MLKCTKQSWPVVLGNPAHGPLFDVIN